MKLPGRWWWLGVIALIVLIAGGWWLIGRSREPRYEGRTAEQWFKQYYKDENPDAAGALRAMRSNALPYLVRVAFSTNEDSALRTNFYNLLSKLPDSWNPPRYMSAGDIREYAYSAVHDVKPSCEELLPLIANSLDQTNSPQHFPALYMLMSITNWKQDLFPYLISVLHETNSDAQLVLSGMVRANGRKMGLRNLLALFTESQPGSRPWLATVRVLGQMDSNAAPAIPLVKEMFEKETDWRERVPLAAILWRIDPGQTYASNYLNNLLTNEPSNYQIRVIAQNLVYVGPFAKALIPALLNALKTVKLDDHSTPLPVLAILWQLGASDQRVSDAFQQRLEAESLEARDTILNAVSTNAEQVLDAVIAKHSDLELWALRKLAINGTTSSIPILKEELNSTNKDISNAAAYSMHMVSHR